MPPQAAYTQAGRPLELATPLGNDVLLPVGLTGQEAISQLFRFQLDLLAENRRDIPFDKLLGQKVTASLLLPGGKKRFFSGIVSQLTQGNRDTLFTTYQMEVVPQFWLLTQKVQSRIFQRIAVPLILKRVLEGMDVAFEIVGKFEPRNYCVQYRESDFAFASRLMEEEGFFYFFRHTAEGHQMVVANTPQSHLEVPETARAIYDSADGPLRNQGRVFDWQKSQRLCPGKQVLRDYCFEMPGKNLEAASTIMDGVPVGKTQHLLQVAGNQRLEVYDFPGGYAHHFDGVDRGGRDQPAELQNIAADSQRTAAIRMQQQTAGSLVIRGASTCRQLIGGYKFTLERHPNADGPYVLTRVEHHITYANAYRSGAEERFTYENRFDALPLALPFRPPAVTPKPVIDSIQTAVVVGPPGEEVFTDKYGRVKVQFPWDRQGNRNAGSSCWLRVSQLAAGKRFGAVHLPRVGQEVVVAFVHGDPDQPLVLGSLYNADNMPPYPLPLYRNYTGMMQQSVAGVPGNSSEIRFETGLGQERLLFHAETDMHQHAEHDNDLRVGHDHRCQVGNEYCQNIGKDHHHLVAHNYILTVGSGGFSWEAGAGGDNSSGGAQGSGMGGGNAPAPEISGGPGATPPTPQPVTNTIWYTPDTSEAPQDWGIGTFQINASNILTIAKISDNKAVFGISTLGVIGINTQAVAGVNTAVTVGLNVEFNIGNKTENTIVGEHVDLAEDHCFAALAAVTMASTIGMILTVAPTMIAMTTALLALSVGSTAIIMSATGIELICGPSSISLTQAGVVITGAQISVL